jgi:hypothetical protein
MHDLSKAIARINKTLNRRVDEKVDAAIEKVYGLIDSLDLEGISVRVDANWNEGDHPRGPDGKFVSVGGAALNAIKAYEKSVKQGSKLTPQGMAKFLIKQDKFGEKDIFEALKAKFGLGDDKKGLVKAVYKKLVNVDKLNLPPLLKESSPEVSEEEPKKQEEEAKAEEPAAPEPAPEPTPAPEPAPTTPMEKAGKLPDQVKQQLQGVIDNYSKLFSENKIQVDSKIDEIYDALQEPDPEKLYKKSEAVNLLSNPGYSQSIEATNKAIEEFQKYAADKAGKTNYVPNTQKQQQVYADLKKIPHEERKSFSFLQNSKGEKIAALLDLNTESIPQDFYAKVSSAYGGLATNVNSQSVNSAMQDYNYHMKGMANQKEAIAMNYYKGAGHGEMNRLLLDPNGPESNHQYIKDHVENFNSIMNRAYVPAETPVFRGIPITFEKLTGFKDPSDAIGRSFEHKNFASCSRSDDTSKFFGNPETQTAVMLKFTIPAGVKGLVLGDQGPSGEKEIVLPPRGVFKIKKVTLVGKGHVVEVEYLGTAQDI